MIQVFRHAVMITGFVFVMMLIIKDMNVLPMLAHSRRAFFWIKTINFVICFFIGAIGIVIDL
jgi:hypothetical protein